MDKGTSFHDRKPPSSSFDCFCERRQITGKKTNKKGKTKMAYLNKVMLIGNIGKDPIVKPVGQRKVISFSLATSRRYKDHSGEQKEQTDWHNIVGWGKVAETMEMLGVKKGTQLYVEGSLTNRSWTDQNGQKRYSTEVNVDSFQLLYPRPGNEGNSGNKNGNSSQQNNPFPSNDDYSSWEPGF